MIKLINILKEINSEEIYKDDSNTWTHVSKNENTIKSIVQKGKFLGINENLNEFSYEINPKISANKQNTNSPNFYQGKIYPGAEGTLYLITFTTNKSYPGDDFESSNWKEVDYPVIPNGNRMNRVSFKKSSNIGILKPEYRDIKNFKFYKYNGENYIKFDPKEIKWNPIKT